MGEILFSLFVGGCLAFTGAFLVWYLGREQRRVQEQLQTTAKRQP